jgi:sugar phosphate isomerase/epimerase
MTDLIGIASWNFSTGTLAERIDRFAAMGYNSISLNTIDARPLANGQMPDVEEAILRHQLPVTIHGGLGPKGEPISQDAILSDFRAYTDWHARTGRLVTINFDGAKKQTETGAWEMRCEEMHDVLKEMLTISDGAGFTVGIEDWPRCNEDLRYVEDLRSYPHYGMLIDLGHLNMRIPKTDDPDHPFSIDAARDYLDAMVQPVNELHIHNNDGKKDLHAPPETGTSDLRALANLLASTQKLASRGARCVSTIELVPAWCGLTDTEGFSAAQRALDFWRGVIPT